MEFPACFCFMFVFWAAVFQLRTAESSFLSSWSSSPAKVARTACNKIPAPCSKRQVCTAIKTEPYYECQCKPEYIAVDGTCIERDPCRFCNALVRNSNSLCPCPIYMTCRNVMTVGQHTCECRGSTGPMCRDETDPCYLAGCHKNAVCRKFGNQARCMCKPGFAGDGKTCLGTLINCFVE